MTVKRHAGQYSSRVSAQEWADLLRSQGHNAEVQERTVFEVVVIDDE